MKKCYKCGIMKEEACFSKNQKKCKDCDKQYYEKNKAKILNDRVQYRSNNKEKMKERNARYYATNKKHISEQKKYYALINKDKIAKYQKEYYEKNKIDINNYKKEYYFAHKNQLDQYQKEYFSNPENVKRRNIRINEKLKKRRQTDMAFKIRMEVSRSINKALKKKGKSKCGESCFNFLPYTPQQLKDHLESKFEDWMTWENHGKYNPKTWDDNDPATWTWNMDHIIVQADLPYTSMDDENFKKCWALSNLRPYSAKQNIIDGATRIRHKK